MCAGRAWYWCERSRRATAACTQLKPGTRGWCDCTGSAAQCSKPATNCHLLWAVGHIAWWWSSAWENDRILWCTRSWKNTNVVDASLCDGIWHVSSLQGIDMSVSSLQAKKWHVNALWQGIYVSVAYGKELAASSLQGIDMSLPYGNELTCHLLMTRNWHVSSLQGIDILMPYGNELTCQLLMARNWHASSLQGIDMSVPCGKEFTCQLLVAKNWRISSLQKVLSYHMRIKCFTDLQYILYIFIL